MAMAGKFDDRENHGSAFIQSPTWTSTVPHSYGTPDIDMNNKSRDNSYIDPMTTNTIAAVVSAFLATTFLILVVFIIRAIRKRRQERQVNRLAVPVIQTITPSSFGASTAAFTNVPIAGQLRWENIATSSAPVLNPESA